MYIYLVDLHGCGVGVRGEVGLLQIESPVGTRQRIYFSLKTCSGTSTRCPYISFFFCCCSLPSYSQLCARADSSSIYSTSTLWNMHLPPLSVSSLIDAAQVRGLRFRLAPQNSHIALRKLGLKTLRASAELLINDAALTSETPQTLATSFRRKK